MNQKLLLPLPSVELCAIRREEKEAESSKSGYEAGSVRYEGKIIRSLN
jgi:hypothetical protein